MRETWDTLVVLGWHAEARAWGLMVGGLDVWLVFFGLRSIDSAQFIETSRKLSSQPILVICEAREVRCRQGSNISWSHETASGR